MNLDNLVLRPNCLMTKHPLVFLTGIRSLFYYEKLGALLQDFIAAHGYVVKSPVLPFRSPELGERVVSKLAVVVCAKRGECRVVRVHRCLAD